MSDESYLLARAEDRALITAVLHRYSNLARERRDWDATARLFEVEAKFRLGDGTSWSRDELSNMVRRGEPSQIRHHVTTIDIQFLDDNTAETETSFLAVTDEASPDHWGRWEDNFRKQADGTWLIADRLGLIDGANPDGWLARVYL